VKKTPTFFFTKPSRFFILRNTVVKGFLTLKLCLPFCISQTLKHSFIPLYITELFSLSKNVSGKKVLSRRLTKKSNNNELLFFYFQDRCAKARSAVRHLQARVLSAHVERVRVQDLRRAENNRWRPQNVEWVLFIVKQIYLSSILK
jgi:hypothetical protein